MKKFLIKIGINIIFIGISIIAISILNNCVKDECMNPAIDSKIQSLPIKGGDTLNVVIAGDSRAEKQLIPSLIEANTSFHTINVAVSGGELISYSHAFEKYYKNHKNIIFVISVSMFQLNDKGYFGHISNTCFREMTIQEKLKYFITDNYGFFRLYIKQIKLTIEYLLKKSPVAYDENIIKELGYREIDNIMDSSSFNKDWINRHLWYKNMLNSGARWRIFQEAFDKLGGLPNRIIIYQPPVSPHFKDIMTSQIDLAEKDFSKKIAGLSQKYDNISFYDFYNNDISALTNEMYSDPQHLNKYGAVIFSDTISNIILSEMHK